MEQLDSEQTTDERSREESVNADPLIGTHIDNKYAIELLLGSGASGRVYKAKHLILDQQVALKLIDPRLLQSEKSMKRFQNEAALLSNFNHPNIVKFQAFGINNDGTPYLAMEFLEGKTLNKILEENGPLAQQQALPFFIDICHGLAYAQSLGVIHRDIKPSNIMIVQIGEYVLAKILDFGVFKITEGANQKLTETGFLIGTANYMSPEQCTAGMVDFRSDIYSLGCLMYECLTGTPPFAGENDLCTMQNHLNKKISTVPAPAGISPELQNLILKCLEKDPANRFNGADELGKALETANIAGSPTVNNKTGKPSIVIICIAGFIICVAIALILLFHQKSTTQTGHTRISGNDLRRGRNALLSSNRLSLQNESDLHPLELWLKANFKNKEVPLYDTRDPAAQKLVIPNKVDAYCLAQSEHAIASIPGNAEGGAALLKQLNKQYESKTDENARLNILYQIARVKVASGHPGELAPTLALIEKPCSDNEKRDANYANFLGELAYRSSIAGEIPTAQQLYDKQSKILGNRKEFDNRAQARQLQSSMAALQWHLPEAILCENAAIADLIYCLRNQKKVSLRNIEQIFGDTMYLCDPKPLVQVFEEGYSSDDDLQFVLAQTEGNLELPALLRFEVQFKVLKANAYRIANLKDKSKQLLVDQVEDQLLQSYTPTKSPFSMSWLEIQFLDSLIRLNPADLGAQLDKYLSKCKKNGIPFYTCSLLNVMTQMNLHGQDISSYKKEFDRMSVQCANSNWIGEAQGNCAEVLQQARKYDQAAQMAIMADTNMNKFKPLPDARLRTRATLIRSLLEQSKSDEALKWCNDPETIQLQKSAECTNSNKFYFKTLHGRAMFLQGKQKEGLDEHQQLMAEYKNCSLYALKDYKYLAEVLAGELEQLNRKQEAIKTLQSAIMQLEKYPLNRNKDLLELLSKLEVLSQSSDKEVASWSKQQSQKIKEIDDLLCR